MRPAQVRRHGVLQECRIFLEQEQVQQAVVREIVLWRALTIDELGEVVIDREDEVSRKGTVPIRDMRDMFATCDI